MNSKKKIAEKRAEELFDLLTGGDLTSAEIVDKTGWRYSQFLKAVQTLRDILAANGDVISVTAEPQGSRETWLYSLRAGKQIVDAEQSRWVINRLQDAERRVETIAHVLEVAVNSLDGRTTEGRKARVYHLHIKRAQEEVALLGEQA
jgi:hypothetical protein